MEINDFVWSFPYVVLTNDPNYIVYSLYATKEVGYDITAADDVMATESNWYPPLAMHQALSTVADVPL